MERVKLTDEEIQKQLGIKRTNNSGVKSLAPIRNYKSSRSEKSPLAQPAGSAPKYGVGMQLPTANNKLPSTYAKKSQPQRLPYAGKVSASLPQYKAVTPSGGSKVPALPYYQAPGISSDIWKKQAEQLKEDVAQQQKTVRPWQNTSGTMQTASYMKTPQAFQKDGRAMSIEKPESVVRNEQKLADLKSSLANAQNLGYMTDYSEQWRAIESRDDAEDVKAKLARMASMKNNIGTDMGQNIASMNEYQRLRGELESKGINAEGVADWLRRNSNVMEAYYQQQRDIARSEEHPIIESLKTVPQSLYGGTGALAGMTQSAMNSRTGEYRPIDTMGDAFDIARSRQTVRGTVGEKAAQAVYEATGNQNLANAAKFLYGTAMSGLDSAFIAALGGGATAAIGATGGTAAINGAASIILGSNAASETMMDVVNRGGSTDQAVAAGILSGAAETIFEKVSIDGLISKFKSGEKGFRAFIKNATLQGASEASEEMATEIANVIADYYVNGGLSEIEQMRQSGMSDVEIANEIAKRVGVAGAGGFLMGFVGGGTSNLTGGISKGGKNRTAAEYAGLYGSYKNSVSADTIPEGSVSEQGQQVTPTAAESAQNRAVQKDYVHGIVDQPNQKILMAEQSNPQQIPYAPGFNPDSQAAPQQLPRAEQTQPQQVPYNPAAHAAETPTQPTLPMAEELNAERQKNAQEPNLPYSNQNMGIVASPELAAAMQPIVDYTTAKPNPEGNRNIEGSVLDNLGQGQSAFDTLDNLLAQSKADAAKKPGAKEGIANVLTERPKKFSKENFAEQKDKVMRKVVDSGYTIDTIAKDVDDQVLYPLYNNAKQSRQAAEYMIGEEQRDINGNRVGESLVSIFKPVTDKGTDYFRDFSTYLYHMHNVDRMSLETNGAQIYQDAIMQLEMENPMLQNATREEVEALASGNSDYRESAIEWLQLDESLNNLQNKPVFGESITADDSRKAAAELLRKNPEFAELAEKVYAYNRNLMKYRVDSGLISQKQADIMNALYPHYVPTFRDTSSTTGMKISGNQAQVARTVRSATGSNLDLMRIDDSMAEQTMQTVRAAKQNLLGARLLEDALKHQDKVGRHIRSVIDRYNSYDMDDPPQLGNDITIFVGGKPVSMQADDGVMEAFQSIQPRKGERIAGLEAVVKANNMFKALVTGANPMFLAKNFARDLQDAGLYAGNLKDFAKNYPKAWTEMVNGGELWQLYKSQGGTGTSYFDYEKGIVTDPNGNIISKALNKIEMANMMVEQAPRFAEFMAVLEKEGRNYEGIQKAMLAAADVTVNFGRGGTATQFLNRTFVPFLNPAVQGADKLVRRFAQTKGAKEWMGLIGRLVLLGIGPALLNELLYDDEEEYQMLNDRDKENNFVFPIGDGIWVKVPKGRALSVFGSAAQRGVRAIKGDKDAFNGFISQAYEQVGVPNPLFNNIFSQLGDAKLGILNKENKNDPGKTWYGSDIEPQRLQGLPVAERYDEKTDELSKWLGKQLNVSPKKINYLLDNYSGVIGDFLLPISTPQAERNPFAAAFSIDSVTNNKLSGEFYDKLDELEQAKNSGNPTAGAAAAYRYMNSVASDISANNKEIREIQADTTIDDKEKLEKVRKIRNTNNTLFKEALDSVPAYMEAAGKSGVVSDKELDKVYLDTNRKQFGAEYALKKYNKKVYENAQKANKSLISYESFYDAYFAQKDVTGDKDKNGKTIALSESGNKKLAIDKATPGLTQKQREVLYDMFDVSKSVWNGYIPNRK